MARFRRYFCKKCGYSIETEPEGNYALMSGTYYNFMCPSCKDIITLRFDTIGSHYYIHCPKCGDHLVNWNPIDGKCPHCKRRKLQQDSVIIMVD